MDGRHRARPPLFAALDAERPQRAAGHDGRGRTCARGEALFDEGDPGDRLYVVTEGKIKLGRTAADGRENLLAVLGPGEMFGELSLFDPGPRTATATAVTDADAARARPRRPAALADASAPRSPSSCCGARPPAAPHQRGDGRPRVQRRARPGRQGAARPRRRVRRARPTTACGSPTTSPRRSSPSWSAPPARPSTRRWPTSPPAAACGSRAGRSSSSTSSASPAAPADRVPTDHRHVDRFATSRPAVDTP